MGAFALLFQEVLIHVSLALAICGGVMVLAKASILRELGPYSWIQVNMEVS